MQTKILWELKWIFEVEVRFLFLQRNALNDSHAQLMVHWLGEGSDVMICLARDPPLGPNDDPNTTITAPSTSKYSCSSSCPTLWSKIFMFAVFISYDYGDTFTDKTENFRLNKSNTIINSTVDLFVTHPKFNTVSVCQCQLNGTRHRHQQFTKKFSFSFLFDIVVHRRTDCFHWYEQ